MLTEAEDVGLDRTLCQCTQFGRVRVRRGCDTVGLATEWHLENVRTRILASAAAGVRWQRKRVSAWAYCPHCAADRRWIRVA